MDRVKLNNIKDFATPQQLADRVVAVEKSKEGTFEVDVFRAEESPIRVSQVGGVPSYDIEYRVDSSRGEKSIVLFIHNSRKLSLTHFQRSISGKNHIVVKATIEDKNLYVFTVQCKDENFDDLKTSMLSTIDSFELTSKL